MGKRATLRATAGVPEMLDVIFVVVGLAFFAAMSLYAYACERL